MVADVVRRLAMRDLPEDLAAAHVDRADRAVRRLEQRQPFDAERHLRLAARGITRCRPLRGRAWHSERPPPADEPEPPDVRGPVTALPSTYAMSDCPGSGAMRPLLTTEPARRDVEDAGLRIERAAGPVRAAVLARQPQGAERPVDLAHDGRRVERSEFVLRRDLERLLAQLRREVDEVVGRHALPVERRRLGRERLRRRVPLARHVALRHRPLLDRPHRLAGHAIEHVEERLLGRLRDAP